jgi:hypothetical protein
MLKNMYINNNIINDVRMTRLFLVTYDKSLRVV